ncbi:hypothetical protein B7463_g6604, partial [Scytalidium lignicola]
MVTVKRVAVIGAGPAGAIAVDALASEGAFDVIRVFERRERAGGCWVQDPEDVLPQIPDFKTLADRTADKPLDIPNGLPVYTPKSKQYRFAETSIYPLLETNIEADIMQFSQEPIAEEKTTLSIRRHGLETPFRHHKVIQKYIEGLLDRKGYQDFVEYNTTVERIEKLKETGSWRLTLRKDGPSKKDYWWTEDFDAVEVASGHYSVPFIPEIQGLEQFSKAYPESVEHSKGYRGPEKYRGKKVVVVGASVSGMDIAVDLVDTAQSPVNAVVRGRYHPYFGETPFEHPDIKRWPPIKYIDSSNGKRTVHFEDDSFITNVDHIILGTGYSWTLPFLPQVPVRNNRIPGLYLHIFKQEDPTLVFIGAIAAGFTFKVFEWQSVLAARFLAGRIKLPDIKEQEKWEKDRIAYKGEGVPFTALYPDFEEYFETVRKLAGEPTATKPGRRLPKFQKEWIDIFNRGHQKRIKMWDLANKAAREKKAREGFGVRLHKKSEPSVPVKRANIVTPAPTHSRTTASNILLYVSSIMPSEYTNAVQGDCTLYDYFGNRVLRSTSTNGRVVAVKIKPRSVLLRSEGKMMNYASQQAGIKAPQVLGCYDIEPKITTMVSDLVSGVSLYLVWHQMNKKQQDSIKIQLKEQFYNFRQCFQPYIGRIERQPTRNFYDRLKITTMGPFDSEDEFDNWCLVRIKSPLTRIKWKYLLSSMRGKDSKAFVLTHGDLAARNIIVKDGVVTGIVDWENAGFFPEYIEYVVAMEICDGHEDWWKPVLKEILEPCNSERLKFQSLIKDRGLL